jgi:pimeloyl-ACP methyl ester carboxylesterase
MTTGTLSRTIEVDVSQALGLPGATLGGWVLAPSDIDPRGAVTIAYCLAGGTCTAGYYDLDSFGLQGYSMGVHLARQGVIVVALDHPGIGASTEMGDLFSITPDVIAAAHDEAFTKIKRMIQRGTLFDQLPAAPDLVGVGIGHSMGGVLLTIQQAHHQTFDMVCSLGAAGGGLPEVLTDSEIEALSGVGWNQELGRYVDFARARFGPNSQVEQRSPTKGMFISERVPADVVEVFVAQATALLPVGGLVSMVPGSFDRDKAAITAPVFLAFGEHDIGDRMNTTADQFRHASDIVTFQLPGAGHCHNLEPNRSELWDAIEAFVRKQQSPSGRVAAST